MPVVGEYRGHELELARSMPIGRRLGKWTYGSIVAGGSRPSIFLLDFGVLSIISQTSVIQCSQRVNSLGLSFLLAGLSVDFDS